MVWLFSHINLSRNISFRMICRKKTICFLLLVLCAFLTPCYAAVDSGYTKESYYFKYVINPEPTTLVYFCDNPEGTSNGDFDSLPDTVDEETNLDDPLFYFRFFSNETGTWNLTITFTSFESTSTKIQLPYSVTVGKIGDDSFSKPSYEIPVSGLEQEFDSISINTGESINSIYSFTYNLDEAFNTGVALDDYEATITIGADGP